MVLLFALAGRLNYMIKKFQNKRYTMKRIKFFTQIGVLFLLYYSKIEAQSINSDFFGYSITVQPPLQIIENKYNSLYIRMSGATPSQDFFGNKIIPDIITVSPLPQCDLPTLAQNYRNAGFEVNGSDNFLIVKTQIMDMTMFMTFLAAKEGHGLIFTLIQHQNFLGRINIPTLTTLLESVKFKIPTASLQAMLYSMQQAENDAKSDSRLKMLLQGLY